MLAGTIRILRKRTYDHICNPEHVRVKAKMSLVPLKMYVWLHWFQHCCKKGFVWRSGFVGAMFTYRVKTKDPLRGQC